MQPHPPKPPFLRQGAFSLVEVVLALGICSFGLVATLGLLPVGLTTARRAIDLTAQAQVKRQLTSVLGQVRYRDLRAMDNRKFYFDDQGVEVVGASDEAKAAKAVYRATLSVPPGTDPTYPAPTAFPSGTFVGGVPSQRLATVTVLVATNGASQNQVNIPIYVADRGW